MKKILHRATERGESEHGWLSSRFSFSFAEWHDPSRMGFGGLRVLNDDTIAPHSGFPFHSHRDMEIITIVTDGAVSHEDSMGNRFVVPAGDVQVMSAGAGVTHSEMNASDKPLKLFQIWIYPRAPGLPPQYAQKRFEEDERTLLVSPDGREGSLAIQQDAFVTRLLVAEEGTAGYVLKRPGSGLYIFVIEGEINVLGDMLGPRDALGVWDTDEVAIRATTPAQVLVFEIPM